MLPREEVAQCVQRTLALYLIFLVGKRDAVVAGNIAIDGAHQNHADHEGQEDDDDNGVGNAAHAKRNKR